MPKEKTQRQPGKEPRKHDGETGKQPRGYDGGEGGDNGRIAMKSPTGDVITTELLEGGDIRVEGGRAGIQAFLNAIEWEDSFTLQIDEAGVTLVRRWD